MTNNENEELQGLDVLDLPPCLMLAVKVSRSGGQHYIRRGEEKLDPKKDGEQRTRYETEKVIDNQDEFKEATSLQSKAKYAAGKLGVHGPLGIVVPKRRQDDVEQYRNEWRQIFREFNSRSNTTRIRFSCMVFGVRGDNIQELQAVLDELRDGLADMEEAYRNADPGSIRDVVKRMNGFADILPERVATKVELAVKAAKKKAKTVAKAEKRVERLRAKIAKVMGPDADEGAVQEELERLSRQVLTPEIRERTERFTRLNAEVLDAANRLEETKQQIDASPIQAARFAVQRRPIKSDEDQSIDLNAAELAARVVTAAKAAPSQD